MKKRILSVVFALSMMMGLAMTANAETLTGSGTVTYSDGALTSNFNLGTVMGDMQPGDTMTITVDVVNGSSDKVDYYLENEVLKAMEDEDQGASGGGYTYTLTYGSRTIIDGDVGGEGTSGMSGATAGQDGYFWLGQLDAGAKETVTLTVVFDGESQANNYENKVATIGLNFGVEPVTSNNEIIKITNPKTGDTNNTGMYTIMTLASGVVLLGLGAWRLVAVRKNREEA